MTLHEDSMSADRGRELYQWRIDVVHLPSSEHIMHCRTVGLGMQNP